MLRNAMGVLAGVLISTEQLYEGLRYNIISVTRRGGIKFTEISVT